MAAGHVIAAALNLCDLISESLRHERHAQHLGPLRIRARTLWAQFFVFQSRDVIRTLSPSIHVLADHLKESGARICVACGSRAVSCHLCDRSAEFLRLAEDDSRDRRNLALGIVPDSLRPLTFSVASSEASEWADILAEAITKGGRQLASDLDIEAAVGEGFMAGYLRENSLQRIAGDIAPETVKQIRAAIVEAYTENSDYGQIVNAIQGVYERFADSRAEMIAQTELNLAYNAARNDVAVTAGMNEKRWATESEDPCPVCVGNEAEGWIPIAKTFSGGVQLPVQHPRCYCSVDFRLVSKS